MYKMGITPFTLQYFRSVRDCLYTYIHTCMPIQRLEAPEPAIGLYKSLNLLSPSTLVSMCNTGKCHQEESQHYYTKSQNTASSLLPPKMGKY